MSTRLSTPKSARISRSAGAYVGWFLVAVALVVTALRLPPVVAESARVSSIEASEQREHEAVIPTDDAELGRVRAFRPLRTTTDASTHAALGSLLSGSIVALVPNAPWSTLGTRGSRRKAWTAPAPTRADLMVFLN